MEEKIESIELQERKEKILNFLKQKKDWIVYSILFLIAWLSVYIRTRNIPGLKDVTTGGYTLGPDLDPFLFLRWAKDIVENGSLAAVDTLRLAPLGFEVNRDMQLLSYMIAWLYNFLASFIHNISVEYAAIIFPVIMFALAVVSFFLFTREIFHKEEKLTKNIIALISTLLFSLIPSILPRTIAGIPEKESAAFFFIFLSVYLFLKSYHTGNKWAFVFALLSGISTGILALVWGGVMFVLMTIPPAVFIAYILGRVNVREIILYLIWMITTFLVCSPFSAQYEISNIIGSISTGVALLVAGLLIISILLEKTKFVEKYSLSSKIPKRILCLIIAGVIVVLIVAIILGPSFIFGKIGQVYRALISPQDSRWGLTVAENKQPYFDTDWKGEFGPVLADIPLYFWLFIFGAILLFNQLIKKINSREKMIMTLSYFLFLICLIFSRHNPDSIFNGVNWISKLVYFGGWLQFFGVVGYYYYQEYKKGNDILFKDFEFSYILYFVILTFGIIGARGGIRLIMILGAISPIAVGFLNVKMAKKALFEKEEMKKIITASIAILIILATIFTMFNYYSNVRSMSQGYAPGYYQWQWQNAMSWVRENTSENAVFAHWWDYGYWVQTLGERATILDGGNVIGNWNFFMGRYVLTGNNKEEKERLEYLYAHNATHLLIDSTDIGKYTAFSSIGSNEDYDKYSWITSFLMDSSQTVETNNETIYVYTGGALNDEDIIWNENGKEVLLPRKKAIVGAIIIKSEKNILKQPEAVFVYNNKQYRIPLRYLHVNNNLIDFKTGIEAGVFLYPKLENTGTQFNIKEIGAAIYLSPRTINSQVARLYLFGEEGPYFKIAHIEDNAAVKDMKNQGAKIGNFLYYQGMQGPIKIWEIKYPSNIQRNETYLGLDENPSVTSIKPGEY